MKTLFSVLASLSVLGNSVMCIGAGAVSLNNYEVNGGNGNPVFFLSPGTLADAGCYITILGGSEPNNLTPILSTQAGIGSVFALQQGMFDGGMGDVFGVYDLGLAFFQAVAWKGDKTRGWQQAQFVSHSSVWSQATGVDTIGQTPAPATLNFPQGFGIYIPEPSILPLSILGALIWLGFRRK